MDKFLQMKNYCPDIMINLIVSRQEISQKTFE